MKRAQVVKALFFHCLLLYYNTLQYAFDMDPLLKMYWATVQWVRFMCFYLVLLVLA